MKKSQAFQSKYFKAPDVEGGSVRAKIESVEWETVGDEEKPVMRFVGSWKPLPLNRTNFESCEEAFGSDESDDWIGKEIEIRSEKVTDPSGRRVDGVRLDAVPKPGASVRVALNARARQQTAAEPTPPVEAYELDDDIPDGPPF